MDNKKSSKFIKPPEFPKNLPVNERFPKWISWLRTFGMAVELAGEKNPRTITALLYTCAGEEIRELIESQDLIKNYSGIDLCSAITDYFKQSADSSLDLEVFREMSQRDNESARSFYIRLKTQALICDVAEKENLILDHFRNGILNKDVARFSRMNKWSLAETVDAAEHDSYTSAGSKFEARAPIRVQQITGENDSKSVNRGSDVEPSLQPSFKKRKRDDNSKTCLGCGGDCKIRSRDCPAHGSNCTNCGKRNHCAKVCQSKPNPELVQSSKSSDKVNKIEQ